MSCKKPGVLGRKKMEEKMCICIANSSQRAVFIDAEAKKTSPIDHPDCGYGSSVFSTPANASGFLQ